MKALILGGTGWVGHLVSAEFANFGAEVVVGTRGHSSTFVDELPAGVRRLTFDKNDAEQMRAVFQESFDVVVDTVPTEASIDHVVSFARNLGRYLHCSSTGGYAPLRFIPGDETHPYDEFMGGWAQKGIVDAKVMDLFFRKGFPATVLRPSYITGPGKLPLDNLGGRRMDFITDILAGTPLVLPNDGQALLHPVHVADLAHAFLLAAREPCACGQIYNICLDRALTLQRYLEVTGAALEREVSITYAPVAEIIENHRGSVHELGLHFLATHMCYDISKAKEQLGYHPRMTTEQAVAETARWAKEFLSL